MSEQNAEKTWLESLKDTVKESISQAPKQIAEELADKAKLGAQELVAAIFNGSPYVMYGGRTKGVDQPLENALQHDPAKQESHQQQQQQDRGGLGR